MNAPLLPVNMSCPECAGEQLKVANASKLYEPQPSTKVVSTTYTLHCEKCGHVFKITSAVND